MEPREWQRPTSDYAKDWRQGAQRRKQPRQWPRIVLFVAIGLWLVLRLGGVLA